MRAIRGLSITPDDVILAPSQSGPAILSLALSHPKEIHAFDPSPTQNHIFELQSAAAHTLTSAELLTFSSRGDTFYDLLLDKISPHLSSQALQYFLSPSSHTCPLPLPSLLLDDTQLRIHTTPLPSLLARTTPESFTLILLRDPLDFTHPWVDALLRSLARALIRGGRVLSAAPGADVFRLEKAGFEATVPTPRLGLQGEGEKGTGGFAVWTKVRCME